MPASTIRAAVLREPGDVRVEEVELDAPGAGEVLVRLAAAGVCHSDLHLVDGALGDGRWPMVLGHEGAGVVEDVGAGVRHVAPGDEVVLCWVPSCRACGQCTAGRPTLCTTAARHSLAGTMPDGTTRFLVDHERLLNVTRELGGSLLDPLKSSVVHDQRSMGTWVVRKRER